MIGYVYRPIGSSPTPALLPNQDLGLKVATPVGTLGGQLLFGWLADVYGRKRMYGIELMIIIIATIGQAVAGRGPGVSILGVLIFWRFLMGLGIVSAIASSKRERKGRRSDATCCPCRVEIILFL